MATKKYKMEVYQVSFRDSFQEHKGYEYFANKAVAERKQREANEESNSDMEVTEISFELSKKGIISLLNIHASYPDNG